MSFCRLSDKWLAMGVVCRLNAEIAFLASYGIVLGSCGEQRRVGVLKC